MIIPISADRLWAVIYHDVENTKNWNSGVAANEVCSEIISMPCIVNAYCYHCIIMFMLYMFTYNKTY